MNHRAPKTGLITGCVAAAVAAVAARELGLPAVAGCWLLALAVCLHRGRAGPELLALPAALAAVELPRTPAPWPPTGPVQVSGCAAAPVDRDPFAATTRFRLVDGHGQEILVVAAGAPGVLPGDTVAATGRCGPQGERRRRGDLPVVQIPAGNLRIEPGAPTPVRLATALRLRLQAGLLAHVPGEAGRLLCSLVLGRGPELPDDLVWAHRSTGLSHLLAVSGAHASMLAWLLGLLWLQRHSASRAGWYRRTGVVILLLYGAVTGMEPPVFRALAAFLLWMVASRRGRRVPLAAALALPALLTCGVDAGGLLGVSFCLSYAAVFGLSLAPWHRREALHRWLITPLWASCWATLLTMPLTLLFFGQVAPWTILATPVLAPLVGLMLAGGLLCGTLDLLGPVAAAMIANALEPMAALYCNAVRLIDALPATPIHAPQRAEVWALLTCGAIAMGLCARLRGRRVVLAVVLLLSLPHFLPPRGSPAPHLRLVAVGHGQACLLHLGDGRQVLIDCGAQGNPRRAARAVDDLLARRRIDLLVITHGDLDHVGGVGELLQRIVVDRAVIPEQLAGGDVQRQLRRAGAAVEHVAAGTHREVAPAISVFAPDLPMGSDNDRSLWVGARIGTQRILLTGDAEEAGVDAARAAGAVLPADVLVLPHHGRANDRAPALLAAVRPAVVLVSNRAGEGVGAQGVVARALGFDVWATGELGDIEVLVEPRRRVLPELPAR